MKDLKRHGAQKAKAIVAQRQGQQDQNDAQMRVLQQKHYEQFSLMNILIRFFVENNVFNIHLFWDQTSYYHILEPLANQRLFPSSLPNI